MKDFKETNSLMKQAISEGIFPSASLLVAKEGSVAFENYYGKCSAATIFDVASLTKPVITTTLAIRALQEGFLNLEDTVTKFFPEAHHLDSVEIFHLLNHSSGLPSWQPYYQGVPRGDVGSPAGRSQIVHAVLDEALLRDPGFDSCYSDLGFILVGEIIEAVFMEPLATLADEFILNPLKMENSFYRIVDKTPWSAATFEPAFVGSARDFSGLDFAPTEDCPWRGEVVSGYVHDQNCYAMGGVAGHAGLFSTVDDLNLFVAEFVSCCCRGGKFLDKNILEQFVCMGRDTVEPRYRGSFLLGWDRPAHENSQAGRHFSKRSIGHLGYTGCSLWIDLMKDFWVILLTNRIHPTSTNERIKSFRPMLHDSICDELFGE